LKGKRVEGPPSPTVPSRSRFAPVQTVLLTAGPRSKLQNSRYFPKFSEAVSNPKKIHDVIEFHKWRCAGKPEMVRTDPPFGGELSEAKFSLDGSANKARVAGAVPR